MFTTSLVLFAAVAGLCAWRMHVSTRILEVAGWWALTAGTFAWSLTTRSMTPGAGLVAFLVLDIAVVVLSVVGVLRLLGGVAEVHPDEGDDGGEPAQDDPGPVPDPPCRRGRPRRPATPHRRGGPPRRRPVPLRSPQAPAPGRRG